MEDDMVFAEMALEPGLEPVVLSYADFTVRDEPALLPCFVLMFNSQAQDLVRAGYQIFRINNYYPELVGQMLYKVVEAPMFSITNAASVTISAEDVRTWRYPDAEPAPIRIGDDYYHVPENDTMPHYVPSLYLTEEQIAMGLKSLVLGHIETMIERFHGNANATQRAKAIEPIVEYVHNISKIITERLTEMEIKINGRNRKIIRKDSDTNFRNAEASRPEEGFDTGIRSSARESERSVGAGEIRTDTNGSLPRPDSRYGLTETGDYIPQPVEDRIRPAISGRGEEIRAERLRGDYDIRSSPEI